jgi:hypothetical protein
MGFEQDTLGSQYDLNQLILLLPSEEATSRQQGKNVLLAVTLIFT